MTLQLEAFARSGHVHNKVKLKKIIIQTECFYLNCDNHFLICTFYWRLFTQNFWKTKQPTGQLFCLRRAVQREAITALCWSALSICVSKPISVSNGFLKICVSHPMQFWGYFGCNKCYKSSKMCFFKHDNNFISLPLKFKYYKKYKICYNSVTLELIWSDSRFELAENYKVCLLCLFTFK